MKPNLEAAAQNAFQNAVFDVFRKEGTKPNASDRARLRDLLANASCPQEVTDYLRGGAVQLDATEFLNFLLTSVMPEKNRVAVVSKVKWKTGAQTEESSATEKQTKLEFSFPDNEQSTTLQAMLQGYQNEEKMEGANQYETASGEKVNAKQNLQPQVTNPRAEIVISLKRFKRTFQNGDSFCTKKNNLVSLDDISLPLQDGSRTQNYRATSFIVHQGGLNGGHYTAYVQESDKQWYCYNDSSRTVVSGADLKNAQAQAYVVKYSPIDASDKCHLPESQGNGTENGGSRCWANAAFAFALSMTSLHDYKHERSVETETPRIKNKRRIKEINSGGVTSPANEEKEIEERVGKILDLDENSDLKAVLGELESIKPALKKSIDARLKDIGAVSTSELLKNAAQAYLCKLIDGQNDEKTDAILGLSGFFSDEGNRKDVLNIIEAVNENKVGFIANPQGFCANLISSSDLTEAKEKLKPKPNQFITTADLCYDAIEEGNADNLKKFLPYAIKQDKDFLTNALCCAVMSNKADIAKLLITDCEAKQDKQSPLYGKSAKEIDDGSGRKKILSPESKTEEIDDGSGRKKILSPESKAKDKVATPISSDDPWKIPYPAKFKTSETGEAFGKTINIVFKAFDMPLDKEWPLKFFEKMLVATAGLALSAALGVFQYLIPKVINTITSPVRLGVFQYIIPKVIRPINKLVVKPIKKGMTRYFGGTEGESADVNTPEAEIVGEEEGSSTPEKIAPIVDKETSDEKTKVIERTMSLPSLRKKINREFPERSKSLPPSRSSGTTDPLLFLSSLTEGGPTSLEKEEIVGKKNATFIKADNNPNSKHELLAAPKGEAHRKLRDRLKEHNAEINLRYERTTAYKRPMTRFVGIADEEEATDGERTKAVIKRAISLPSSSLEHRAIEPRKLKERFEESRGHQIACRNVGLPSNIFTPYGASRLAAIKVETKPGISI